MFIFKLNCINTGIWSGIISILKNKALFKFMSTCASGHNLFLVVIFEIKLS